MYAVVDIETTGGNYQNDKITEIAVFVYDGTRIVDEFSTLINPEKHIPYFITKITGITDDMVSDAPKFYEIAKRIVELTQNRIFVAHNVNFDYNFIRNEFKQLGYDYNRELLCTVKKSRQLIKGLRSYSLGNLCDDLDIKINNRHRAAGDALATVKILEKLLQIDNISKPLNLFPVPEMYRQTIDKKIIDALPTDTGVYYFLDDKLNPIYIGKSTNIRNRVMTHFQKENSKRALEMKSRIHDINFEITGSELAALLLESYEIKKAQPRYNRAQRRTSSNFGIYSFTDKNGYLNLEIRNNDADEIPIVAFNNRKKTEKTLHEIIEQYNLCQKLSGVYKTDKSCFNFQVKKCNGACTGIEKPEHYNFRVNRFIEKYEFGVKDCFIIDKGRKPSERTIIRVANGKYMGFGYIDVNEMFTNTEALCNCIKKYPDNKDAQQIIKTYLTHKKVEKVLKF